MPRKSRQDGSGSKRTRKPRKVAGRSGGPDAGKDAPERSRGGLAELLRSVLVAAVIFVVLRTFLVQTFVITSGSMEDTLLVGDFLVVNRAALGGSLPFTRIRAPGYSEPHRFDVLVFDPPHEDDLKLVKRLIGMPGDTVAMRDGRLILNGDEIDEPYTRYRRGGPDQYDPWMEWQRDYLVDTEDPASYRPTRDSWGPLVIPEDRYFMLGDNRNTSLDSRYWGLLEGWRLEGRAVFIYFSYDRDAMKPFPAFTAARLDRVGDVIR